MAVPPLAVAIMLEEMADIIVGLSPQGGFDEELAKARDFARQVRGYQLEKPCSDQES